MSTDPIRFPADFLWGAATAAHQTEGNNVSSDWWAIEHAPNTFVKEPSGDAIDSFHRWPEDMRLAADAGLTDYRFSIEWARIEPEKGEFSQAAIAHYRSMVDGALAAGLRPMVTLHHFTTPLWFARKGGWKAPEAIDDFLSYVHASAPVFATGVERICTINEPNMVAVFDRLAVEGPTILSSGMPEPDPGTTRVLIDAHHRATALLRREHPQIAVGWSIAAQCFEAAPGAEKVAAAYAYPRETVFFEAAKYDDWIGVQSYTRTRIADENGQAVRIPPAPDAELTLTGWEYYPQAIGGALRAAAAATGGVPAIVTENGIATADDTRRIAYTAGALTAVHEAMQDGITVLGYLHWSLLDNYEWGQFGPTFGLIAVDRNTFQRTPKPSLGWLGAIARSGVLTTHDTDELVGSHK